MKLRIVEDLHVERSVGGIVPGKPGLAAGGRRVTGR